MSSVINKDDASWKIFCGYVNLIGDEASKSGLDIYGVEQRTDIAAALTQAHMMEHVSSEIKDHRKQQERLNRFTRQSNTSNLRT